MSFRDRINKHLDQGVLHPASLPLAYADELYLESQWPAARERFSDPERFEYLWEDSGIAIKGSEDRTFYPPVGEAEIRDALTCPVPHAKLLVVTKATREDYLGESHICWSINGTHNGFDAEVFVKTGDRFIFSGQSFVLDRTKLDEGGLPIVECRVPNSYPNFYDKEELWDQCLQLLRYFRLLCHPKVKIHVSRPDEGFNLKRVEQGKRPLSEQRIIRVSGFVWEKPEELTGVSHSSPVGHDRRSHVRVLKSGLRVTVRGCKVNGGAAPGLSPIHIA